jgi:hypothetical protein
MRSALGGTLGEISTQKGNKTGNNKKILIIRRSLKWKPESPEVGQESLYSGQTSQLL